MYSAGLLYIIGIPLLLGSRYGLACTPLFVLGVALRAHKEEEFLARDLAGYDAYRRQVRWRLMPGIW
jgi:protein-S-isoprenylcysteine O-methyltransferase Ste14